MQIISLIFSILFLVVLVWIIVGPIIAIVKILRKSKLNNRQLIFYFSGVLWLIVLMVVYFILNIILGFFGVGATGSEIPTLQTLN